MSKIISIAAIVALTAVFSFSQEGINFAPLKQSDFYGEWNLTNGTIVDEVTIATISSKAIKYSSIENTGEPFEVYLPILRWEPIENPDKASNHDFPDGYIIRTESTGGVPKTAFLLRHSKNKDIILFVTSVGSLLYVRAKYQELPPYEPPQYEPPSYRQPTRPPSYKQSSSKPIDHNNKYFEIGWQYIWDMHHLRWSYSWFYNTIGSPLEILRADTEYFEFIFGGIYRWGKEYNESINVGFGLFGGLGARFGPDDAVNMRHELGIELILNTFSLYVTERNFYRIGGGIGLIFY